MLIRHRRDPSRASSEGVVGVKYGKVGTIMGFVVEFETAGCTVLNAVDRECLSLYSSDRSRTKKGPHPYPYLFF